MPVLLGAFLHTLKNSSLRIAIKVYHFNVQYRKYLTTHLFYTSEILTNGKINGKIPLVSNVQLNKVLLPMFSKTSNIIGTYF